MQKEKREKKQRIEEEVTKKKTRATHCNVSDKIDNDIYSKNKNVKKRNQIDDFEFKIVLLCISTQNNEHAVQRRKKKNRFLFCVQMYFWLQFFP